MDLLHVSFQKKNDEKVCVFQQLNFQSFYFCVVLFCFSLALFKTRKKRQRGRRWCWLDFFFFFDNDLFYFLLRKHFCRQLERDSSNAFTSRNLRTANGPIKREHLFIYYCSVPSFTS